MARYSLFVLKVPLTISQPTNHKQQQQRNFQGCRGYGYPWIYIHVWISDLGHTVDYIHEYVYLI